MHNNFKKKKYYIFSFIGFLYFVSFFTSKIYSDSHNKNSVIWKEDEGDLNKQKNKIKWENIEINKNNENKIRWELINIDQPQKTLPLKEDLDNNNNFESTLEKLYKEEISSEFLSLGLAVPTAKVLSQGDFDIYLNQNFPLSKGYEGGSSNQNYSILFNYGWNDNLTLGGFFSHSDDPLTKKIKGLDIQPANKWISFGSSFRYKLFENNNYSLAIDNSVEGWYVKSGGCNGIGCKGKSNNIFDRSLNEVKSLNLISSFGLPFTWEFAKNSFLTFSPKITFLPEYQGEDIKGKFYGLNYGFGFGISKKFNTRFNLYASTYIPFGKGNNTFDENISFKKSIIYSLGINYTIDPKMSFETYLSNSFGSTPSTGILTIPSDNDLIIGSRIIYKPFSIDLPTDLELNRSDKYNGLSVTSTYLIEPDKYNVDLSIDSSGSYWTTITRGVSSSFNFEFLSGKMSNKSTINNKYSKNYIKSNDQTIRFGGKAILLKESEGNLFSSGIRLTFGRSLGKTWPGYLFVESANNKKLTERISFNFNPKLAWTGSGSPSSIGLGLNWKIYENLFFIPETNLGVNQADDNFSLALRYKPMENSYLDLYVSNAFNFYDLGELIKSNNIKFGFNFGIKI